MHTLIIDVAENGSRLHLRLKGAESGQAVLVLSDGVELVPSGSSIEESSYSQFQSSTGFPPRDLTEATIIQVLREHGGEVKITNQETGWNIYDEIAARLGVSIEARQRRTRGTGETAWRPEVGFARKNLEQSGLIAPTQLSGKGVWRLAVKRTGEAQRKEKFTPLVDAPRKRTSRHHPIP